MIRQERKLGWIGDVKESAEDLAFDHRMDISASVYRRLGELGLTQAQLAERMGVDQGRISRIITGKQNMTIGTIAKLEEALDFRLDEGFRYKGKPECGKAADLDVELEYREPAERQEWNIEFEVTEVLPSKEKFALVLGGEAA